MIIVISGMRKNGSLLVVLLVLSVNFASGQSSVGGLGGASDAAQRVFDGQARPVLPDTMPDFPGGPARMYKFMKKTLVYPQTEATSGVQGRVYVEFIVETSGKLNEVQVRKSLGPAFDKEALRMVKAMPDWTPAREDGKPIRARMTIPVDFKLP